LISFVNHYYFRTYALDLGLYTNALYKYGHFVMADNLMIKENYESILGGHFDLYLMLFSPFIYLFGTATLLVVQIAFLLIGGVGIFNYFKIKENDSPKIAYFAIIYFFLFFGVFSALSFDYHSVVVASSLIPWFFYHFYKQKYIQASILFLLILISQENVSLFLIFIFLGLMIEFRKNKVALYLLSIYSVFSFIYFIVVIQILIPYYSKQESYTGFLFSALGDTPLEAIKNLISHPIQNFKFLFINHTNHPLGHLVKRDTHLAILASGLFLLFFKPYYLLMLLPIYGQKFYHDGIINWGRTAQYSIEFAPILAIGVFSVIVDLKNKLLKNGALILVMIGVISVTIDLIENDTPFLNESNIKFYGKSHYTKEYDVKVVYKQLSLIPENAKISSQSSFIPHLVLRDNIYQFPIIKDAEYIIFSTKESSYPLSSEDFLKEIDELISSKEWRIKFKNNHFTILRKVKR